MLQRHHSPELWEGYTGGSAAKRVINEVRDSGEDDFAYDTDDDEFSWA